MASFSTKGVRLSAAFNPSWKKLRGGRRVKQKQKGWYISTANNFPSNSGFAFTKTRHSPIMPQTESCILWLKLANLTLLARKLETKAGIGRLKLETSTIANC